MALKAEGNEGQGVWYWNWTLATGKIFDMSDVKFYHIFSP
jgi:hypothetical protein